MQGALLSYPPRRLWRGCGWQSGGHLALTPACSQHTRSLSHPTFVSAGACRPHPSHLLLGHSHLAVTHRPGGCCASRAGFVGALLGALGMQLPADWEGRVLGYASVRQHAELLVRLRD